MKKGLSVLMLTQNNEETIEKSVESVIGIADEVIVVDGYSKDKTLEIVHKVLKSKVCKVFQKKYKEIGEQRQFGLSKITKEWVLILDSDEVVSKSLQSEILKRVQDDNNSVSAYVIPFQNNFLGRQLRYGGEDYKMTRLFKKDYLKIDPSIIHNKFSILGGKIGWLKGKIYHYSYRSLGQVFKKFTGYAIKTAYEKNQLKEKSSLKKIFLYPVHMFYSRFVKDKGYKDGMFRISLDVAFAYMEFITYLLLAIMSFRTSFGIRRRS